MGEIADAILGGFFCDQCGGYIDGDEPGYPRTCTDCGGVALPDIPVYEKVKCQLCGKAVKAVGIGQHMRDKHGGVWQ